MFLLVERCFKMPLEIAIQGHAYVGCPQVKASGADDSCIFQRKRITVFRGFVVFKMYLSLKKSGVCQRNDALKLLGRDKIKTQYKKFMLLFLFLYLVCCFHVLFDL